MAVDGPYGEHISSSRRHHAVMASDCVGRLCRAIAKNYHSNDEYFDDIRRRPLSRRSVTFVQLICLYLGTVDRLALGTTLTVGKGMRYDVSILNSSN